MMNLRLIARRVPATRAFTTSRVAYSGKSDQTEVSEGGSRHEEHAGDGGASGGEDEDGRPVSMKRSVKNNMFRYI